jgi:uncharacterized protein YdaU (DUF1376 family)
MAKSPAFQLYAKDFLEGTAEMSNSEAGAFIKLLCHQWMKGTLRNDDKILTRLCNGDTEGLEVAKQKFKVDESGNLYNPRLAEEKEKQSQYSKSQAEIGKKGAEIRWGKNRVRHQNPIRVANGETMALHTASTTTSTEIQQPELLPKIFEAMRVTTDRSKFSDAYLQIQAERLYERYKHQKIGNLGNLVATVVRDLPPDILPKRMVL